MNKGGGASTWCWSSHVHGWGSYWSLSWGQQWRWGAHLTGRGLVPPRLPLACPRGGGLLHRLVSPVCAGRLSPAAPVSWGPPLGLGGFVPAVLTDTSCGSSVSWRGVARRIPPRCGSSSRCVAWSGVPHTGTGGGPRRLASFGTSWGFIPAAVDRSVCWCVTRSLQKTTETPSGVWLHSHRRHRHGWPTSALESAWSQLVIFLGVALEGVWSAVWSQRRFRFGAACEDTEPLTALRSPDLAFSAICRRISL